MINQPFMYFESTINKANHLIMKKLYLSLLFSFISLSIFSQMRIIDPQNQWWQSKASIENVHIEMKPAGIFCETAITFDVKSSESDFNDETPLEYIYDFSMPDDVVFNDSWLWIEDYISEGQIYEQSEGTAIYESIVDRQQDPSILAKSQNDNYNFRIYPLFDDSTRRVKLSYIVPFKNENISLESTLPLSFLRDSYEKPQNVTLSISDDENWFHTPINSTEWIQTSSENNVTTYTLSNESTFASQDVIFNSEVQEEYSLGVYEEDGTKYFQLIYEPELEFETAPTYNLILLDHESDNTNVDRNTILSLLSDELNELTEVDKFNILFHDFTPKFTNDAWATTDPENIAAAINIVSASSATTFSWLSTLLPEALAYVEEKGQNTRIVIISADNNFYEEESSNDFLSTINDFISQMSTEASISILDYSKHRPGDWIGGEYYRGNEFLYNRLAQQNNGTYQISLSQNAMTTAFKKIFIKEVEYIDEYDLDIDNEFGFSYSNFIVGPSQKILLGEPIMMTGKYIGSAPFNLEFNALYNNEVIQKSLTLTPNIELDTKATTAWAAQHLLNNENTSDQDVRNDVVDLSIRERVLCTQTVFLCLERDFLSISSNNGEGEGGDIVLIATEDTKNNENQIIAYPNPFTEYVNIDIPANFTTNNEDIKVQILSVDGKLLKTVDQKTVLKDGKFTVQWVPEFDVEGGIYFVRIITESNLETLKIMFVK
jgi:hypothetical protein